MDKMTDMLINGSILIAAIICFRHFFFHQVPKRFLVILWICAMARLLLPVSVPVRLPADCRWNRTAGSVSLQLHTAPFYKDVGHSLDTGNETAADTAETTTETIIRLKDILFTLWLTVAVLLAIRITIKHICCCRLYNASLPVSDEKSAKWHQTHHSLRKVTLRKSDFIRSPLTYGMIRPVILLPSEINLNEEEFQCIMEHEWIHIRRWDVLVKYLLYLTVCIYWFHPLVWIMSMLLNKDMEMACDEEVIKNYSGSAKKTYALVLIRLAENRRDSMFPANACFAGQSEIEERIWSIMKAKKYSWKAAVLAVGMVCCTITTFTAFAKESSKETAVEAEKTDLDKNGAADYQPAGQNTLESVSFVEVSRDESARMKDVPLEEPVADDNEEGSVASIEDLAGDIVDPAHMISIPAESMGRAASHIDNLSIAPGAAARAENAYSLEAGETVTIRCSYTPFDAGVDFGLITPDGNFRHVNRTNGSINQEIKIGTRGQYRLAIRNNSDRTVSVAGYVSY